MGQYTRCRFKVGAVLHFFERYCISRFIYIYIYRHLYTVNYRYKIYTYIYIYVNRYYRICLVVYLDD